MGTFKDLTGMRFGYLQVVKRTDDKISKSGRRRTQWECLCDCGNTVIVTSDALLHSGQVSCGCYRRKHAKEMFTTHGQTDTRLYGVWSSMKSRCYCESVPTYNLYGGRGIRVCDEWRNDFQTFYDWAIAHGYDETAKRGQCTIDRIDVDGNYEPDNCRFITQQEQMNNVRYNHYLEYNEESHTIAEWSRITGIDAQKICNRLLKLGWATERALSTI